MAPVPSLKGGFKAVLFDIDGTLTDTDPLHFAAFQEMFLEVNFNEGKPIKQDWYLQNICGQHNPVIMRNLFPHWTEEEREAFGRQKELRFQKLAADRMERMTGLDEFLTWLDAQGKLSIAVTNSPRFNAEFMLSALKLNKRFSGKHLVIGEECSRAKPHPEPYIEAMRRLNVAASESIVIEDSKTGIQAGVAAGAFVIGIMSSSSEEDLRGAGAHYCIKDFGDLMAIV